MYGEIVYSDYNDIVTRFFSSSQILVYMFKIVITTHGSCMYVLMTLIEKLYLNYSGMLMLLWVLKKQ